LSDTPSFIITKVVVHNGHNRHIHGRKGVWKRERSLSARHPLHRVSLTGLKRIRRNQRWPHGEAMVIMGLNQQQANPLKRSMLLSGDYRTEDFRKLH